MGSESFRVEQSNILFCWDVFDQLLHTATPNEVFPCFFLSCKANARVKPVKMGHGLHSS